MLLFVLSTLVVFHFALPTGADEVAAQGLLWVALVFTALLGLARAWAPEREDGALDGLVLAPSRPERDLARQVGRRVRLPRRDRARRAARVRALLLAARRRRRARRRCSRTSASARSAPCSPRWPRRAATRELILPLLFLPLAIPLVVGGVGASVATEPGRYLAFLGLYDAVFAILCWASFEYVVSE